MAAGRAELVETSLLNIQADTIIERQNQTNDPTVAKDDPPSILQNEANRSTRHLAQCFLRLIHLDNDILDRMNRYEASLWRQVAQTLMILKGSR